MPPATTPQRYVRDAPAKINLALRVRRRRADGYHELDTIFVPLELADRVKVEISAAGVTANAISCRCPGHPELDGANNLAARAAARYLERSGIEGTKIEIQIHKQIWTAAGLGGGSSDAAATLLALEERFGALGSGPLARLAATLGADVPYFLDPQVLRGRGVGELLEPLVAALPRLAVVLANPGQPLSTRAVFEQLGLAPGKEHGPALDLADLPAQIPPRQLSGLVANDLLAPARQLCPAIGDLLANLAASGAMAQGLSGSGPTVFGLFEGRDQAHQVAAKLSGGGIYLAETTSAPRRLTPSWGSPI